ncbi:hypothetical protein AB4Y90_18295, partial [Chryseobacterium sp. 2TAF14]|uniref:hypothetical protein n=1 Tax=Chryseobacterium sp. 2TAF14 TaxID=3233007 RepID=UPI003F93390C
MEKEIDVIKEKQSQKILAYEDAKNFNQTNVETNLSFKENSIINKNETNGIIPIKINHSAPQVPIDSGFRESKIEEVVVLGYAKTSTKAKSVSSSVTVSSETLENRPNVSVLNSIQGTA